MASKEQDFQAFLELTGISLQGLGVLSEISDGLDGAFLRVTGGFIQSAGSIYGYSRDGVLTYEEVGATGAGIVGGVAAGYAAGAIVVVAIGSNPAGLFAATVVGGFYANYVQDGMLDALGTHTPMLDFNRLSGPWSNPHLSIMHYEFPDAVADPRCFPATTPIAVSLRETRPISELRVGDTVLAFDPGAELGRGALVPRRVVRLYRNTTEAWVRLTWEEGGEAKELVATPGHHVLDRFGGFPTIGEMLSGGRATVVLASGELAEVTAERIVYSAETAHLFERAQAVGMIAGNAAPRPSVLDAWQTYNFEVEDLHTYVAGGVRVHNDSGWLGRVGNALDAGIDGALGATPGGELDRLTDALTRPLHEAGTHLEGHLSSTSLSRAVYAEAGAVLYQQSGGRFHVNPVTGRIADLERFNSGIYADTHNPPGAIKAPLGGGFQWIDAVTGQKWQSQSGGGAPPMSAIPWLDTAQPAPKGSVVKMSRMSSRRRSGGQDRQRAGHRVLEFAV